MSNCLTMPLNLVHTPFIILKISGETVYLDFTFNYFTTEAHYHATTTIAIYNGFQFRNAGPSIIHIQAYSP